MANPYRIKANATRGMFMGREVIVLERNHIFGYAIIKNKQDDCYTMRIPLSALH